MRAVVCRELGDPSRLVVEDWEDPSPAEGIVTVDVEAAGVNFPDGLMVRGTYQTKLAPPFIPGSEVCGTVSRVGPGVESLRVGDRVVGFCGSGGYAERVNVAEKSATRLPASVDGPAAAGLTVTYSTAWLALMIQGRVVPGETVLVLGAAGGVGMAAVQIANAAGATVIAVASTDQKRRLSASNGADHVLASDAEHLTDKVRQLTGGRGVDVVVDPVGGDVGLAAMRALAWAGRFLVVGFASGGIPEVKLNRVLLTSSSVIGVLWGEWARRNPEANEQMLAQLVAAVESGSISPVVHRVYPLDEAAQALEDVMSREAVGKVIISATAVNEK